MNKFHWILRLNGLPLSKARVLYNEIRQKSPEEFNEWQQRKCWEIANYHIEHNPLYRKTGKQLPDNWDDLPVMKKSSFQFPLEQILSGHFKKSNVYISHTSGSSGHPFYFAKDKYCHALSWVQILDLFEVYGLTPNKKQARFYGIPLSYTQKKKELLKDWMANRVRFPVFDLSDEVLNRWVEKFRSTEFSYLYGYTSTLVYFARHCIEKGICLKQICPSLTHCMVTAEVCTEEDRMILKQGFGTAVVNEYGASEIGLLAFENEVNEWRLCEELVYIEVVDEFGNAVPQGVSGKILCTSLFNRAFPFIRYEIGDIGIINRLPDGKRILNSLEGRTNDIIQMPSGKTSPGLTFYYISKSLLEAQGMIKEFIIRQTAIDTFEFDIVPMRKLVPEDVNLIQRKMDLYLEPGLKLVINQLDCIKRPGSGKIKHFYSEI